MFGYIPKPSLFWLKLWGKGFEKWTSSVVGIVSPGWNCNEEDFQGPIKILSGDLFVLKILLGRWKRCLEVAIKLK